MKTIISFLLFLSMTASAAYYPGRKGPMILWAGTLAADGTSLCTTTFAKYEFLRVTISIAGYAAGETASLQFNGDTTARYRYRWLQSAAGSTNLSAGLIGATVDRIKVGSANTARPRNSIAIIQNNTVQNEKLVTFPAEAPASGAIGTQTTLDFGNGAWFSGSAVVQITSICLVTTGGQNMLAGTGFVVEGMPNFP